MWTLKSNQFSFSLASSIRIPAAPADLQMSAGELGRLDGAIMKARSLRRRPNKAVREEFKRLYEAARAYERESGDTDWVSMELPREEGRDRVMVAMGAARLLASAEVGAEPREEAKYKAAMGIFRRKNIALSFLRMVKGTH